MSIDLNLAPEQQQVVASARAMLESGFPVARLRPRAAGPGAAGMLAAIAGFGGFALWRSEAEGGAGMSIVEEALLHVELGRFLATPSALATSLAARLAAGHGDSALADAFADGRAGACLANAAGLDGTQITLLDWQGASHALLWRGGDMALLDTASLDIAEAKPADHTVTLGRAALPQGAIVAAAKAESRLTATGRLLLSAQFLGMAQAARDMGAEYAKIRTQFGSPIGAFQAIKHRCADMAIRAEVIEAQLAFAALAERDGWPDADFQIDACRLLAARYALENAASNIQVHGGIGFSAEADAHLYLLRVRLLETVGGGLQAVQPDFMTRRGFASAEAP